MANFLVGGDKGQYSSRDFAKQIYKSAKTSGLSFDDKWEMTKLYYMNLFFLMQDESTAQVELADTTDSAESSAVHRATGDECLALAESHRYIERLGSKCGLSFSSFDIEKQESRFAMDVVEAMKNKRAYIEFDEENKSVKCFYKKPDAEGFQCCVARLEEGAQSLVFVKDFRRNHVSKQNEYAQRLAFVNSAVPVIQNSHYVARGIFSMIAKFVATLVLGFGFVVHAKRTKAHKRDKAFAGLMKGLFSTDTLAAKKRAMVDAAKVADPNADGSALNKVFDRVKKGVENIVVPAGPAARSDEPVSQGVDANLECFAALSAGGSAARDAIARVESARNSRAAAVAPGNSLTLRDQRRKSFAVSATDACAIARREPLGGATELPGEGGDMEDTSDYLNLDESDTKLSTSAWDDGNPVSRLLARFFEGEDSAYKAGYNDYDDGETVSYLKL